MTNLSKRLTAIYKMVPGGIAADIGADHGKLMIALFEDGIISHGYAVENTSLPTYAKMSFFNVNDGTVEGITYTDIPAFSVQFHPEACGGPHDTNFLFDNFLKMMEENHASK